MTKSSSKNRNEEFHENQGKNVKHFDILSARKAYAEGKNITELLRQQINVKTNTAEIIEAAYDLQAGTYIQHVTENPDAAARYTSELATILDKHITRSSNLLDIGTGELTTLSLVVSKLTVSPKKIYGFDISWSRLFKGLAFARKEMARDYKNLTAFVAEISEIPFPDKSFNITTSSHALEPNGEKLKALLHELFRVTIDKLVLFEPCYEINSDEGKLRMDKLGYIKNICGVVEELGGKVVEQIRISHVVNPLNPTVCFVITPPVYTGGGGDNDNKLSFSVPGTNLPLSNQHEFYFSNETGLCYPILRSIPILRSSAAILASSLCD